ncbi:dihydrofolate reductase family protein [Streptomyces venezuelae]|uniref:dihydrofolate reductase family protein n=1 Tax=Streptomyces venezuelae TaxID=54571 RepID=UPI003432F91B
MAAGQSMDAARRRAMFDQAMPQIAGRFGRAQPRATARAVVLGSLSGVERKNFDRVDQIRADSDAILIGAGTMRADNPDSW